MTKIPKLVRQYMAKLGQKGGLTTGDSKRRNPEKMRQAALKSWENRRKK